jgi:hypothetical protein
MISSYLLLPNPPRARCWKHLQSKCTTLAFSVKTAVVPGRLNEVFGDGHAGAAVGHLFRYGEVLGSAQSADQFEATDRLKIKRKNARYLVIRSPRHPPDSCYFEPLHRTSRNGEPDRLSWRPRDHKSLPGDNFPERGANIAYVNSCVCGEILAVCAFSSRCG